MHQFDIKELVRIWTFNFVQLTELLFQHTYEVNLCDASIAFTTGEQNFPGASNISFFFREYISLKIFCDRRLCISFCEVSCIHEQVPIILVLPIPEYASTLNMDIVIGINASSWILVYIQLSQGLGKISHSNI